VKWARPDLPGLCAVAFGVLLPSGLLYLAAGAAIQPPPPRVVPDVSVDSLLVAQAPPASLCRKVVVRGAPSSKLCLDSTPTPGLEWRPTYPPPPRGAPFACADEGRRCPSPAPRP
jgi:hypothetical protein